MRVRCDITFLILGLSLAGFTAGCKKKTAVAPPAPPPLQEGAPLPAPPTPTASITVEPSVVEAGQAATLTWSTTDATAVTVSGLGVIGCRGEPGSPSGEGHYVRARRERSRRLGYRVRDCQRHGAACLQSSRRRRPSASKSLEDRVASELSDVYFDYDKSDFREDAIAALAERR